MVRHVAGIAEVVEDFEAALSFYRDVLGLAVTVKEPGGYAVAEIAGVLHFGIWHRAHAARSSGVAAERVPLGVSLGFEVDVVDAAAATLAARGLPPLQSPHDEPWGQRTARFLAPSGLFFEVSESPWARTVP